MRWIVVVVLLLVAASLFGGRTFHDNVVSGDVDIIPNDDPAMAAAVIKARATLPAFLEASEHPKAGTHDYAVKVGLGPKSGQEFFWIAPFTVAGDTLTGQLDNEPRTILGYRKGQTISVPLSEVTDWMYLDGATTKGNYSACALLTHESSKEQLAFQAEFKLDCDSR